VAALPDKAGCAGSTRKDVDGAGKIPHFYRAMDFRRNLLDAAADFCKVTGQSLATVATKVANDGKFFDRIEAGGGCTMRTYERFMAYFEENRPSLATGKILYQGKVREKYSIRPRRRLSYDESPTNRRADVAEVEAFLAERPDIKAIDLLIPDTCGVLRGKRAVRDKLSKVYKEGLPLPGSVFESDITGATVDSSWLAWEDGDPDHICWPVPGSLKPVPWLEVPTGQLLMTMFEPDGQPFFADPRHVLENVVARFTEAGLTPVVAVELEFYLLDRSPAPDGRPQPPVSPVTGRRQTTTQVYGIDELDQFDLMLQDIAAACAAQDVPADAALSEYAPGQYEINLWHVPDPVLAADHAVLLKRAIKGVAARHGMGATFMAKPFMEVSASGTHVHFSLLDRDGRNLFDDGSELGSEMLRHAVGGMAATMAEAMALFAPNANSYRRFQSGSYVPLAPVWGLNNRTLALRIPIGPGEARRIEHRVAGADANPYLVIAAVLAGAHYGITKKIEPEPPVTGNAHTQREPGLPLTWDQALAAFDQAAVLPGYFDADFRRVYSRCKQAERERFNTHISEIEYEWYLNVV